MYSGEIVPAARNFETIDSYQEWVSENWVHPIGSHEAQVHTRAKFEEETKELGVALRSDNHADILTEVGDVLWTATATAANGHLTIDGSLRYRFPSEFADDAPLRTDAVTASVPRLTSFVYPDLLKLGGVLRQDPLWDGGREPWSDSDVLHGLSHALGKAAMQWYDLSPLIDPTKPPQGFSDGWIMLKAERAMWSLAETVIYCGNVAETRLGIGLEQVMQDNYAKLTGRMTRGEQITRPPAGEPRTRF